MHRGAAGRGRRLTARGRRLATIMALVAGGTWGASAAAGAALGTAFTYQGRLKASNLPANGSYDLQFTLYDAATAGNAVGATVTMPVVAVNAGLFTVQLDFGAAPFAGNALWVQIAVRPANTGNYTPLTPRQPLSAAPFSLYATNGNWARSGTAISNQNTGGFVGINRTSTVSSAEYFGVQAPVQSGYGGMYIATDGAAGQPFYGYVAGGGSAWTYLDGPSGDWRLSVNGTDRVAVSGPSGRVGIGTLSPQAALHVDGDVRISNGPLTLDGPYNSSAGAMSAYAITSGDMLSVWNDGTGNAAVFQAHQGNAVNATILAGAGGHALNATTGGGGAAVNAVTTGTGRAGYFQVNNANSSAAALEATTNGTGLAGKFNGDVQVNGAFSAHCGASLNRATPIAFGAFSLDQSATQTITGSGNVSVTYLGNDTYRINVTGESNPASWIVVANVAYSDPANPDLQFDNIRVGTANSAGHIAIYAPCTSGCGTFTSQTFLVNYVIYKP